jgi:hypothetical protein
VSKGRPERKADSLDISQSYGPSWPVTGIALPYLYGKPNYLGKTHPSASYSAHRDRKLTTYSIDHRWWIWYYHSSDYDEYGFLGCNAVQFGDSLTFGRGVMPSSLKLKIKPSKKPAEVRANLLP